MTPTRNKQAEALMEGMGGPGNVVPFPDKKKEKPPEEPSNQLIGLLAGILAPPVAAAGAGAVMRGSMTGAGELPRDKWEGLVQSVTGAKPGPLDFRYRGMPYNAAFSPGGGYTTDHLADAASDDPYVVDRNAPSKLPPGASNWARELEDMDRQSATRDAVRPRIEDNGAIMVGRNAANPEILAHEAGHSRIHRGDAGGLVKFLQDRVYPFTPLISHTISPLASMGAGYAAGSAGKGALIGAGIGTVGGMGQLIPEAAASSFAVGGGLGSFEGGRHNTWKSKGALAAAFLTYLAANAGPSAAAGAIGGAISGLRRSAAVRSGRIAQRKREWAEARKAREASGQVETAKAAALVLPDYPDKPGFGEYLQYGGVGAIAGGIGGAALGGGLAKVLGAPDGLVGPAMGRGLVRGAAFGGVVGASKLRSMHEREHDEVEKERKRLRAEARLAAHAATPKVAALMEGMGAKVAKGMAWRSYFDKNDEAPRVGPLDSLSSAGVFGAPKSGFTSVVAGHGGGSTGEYRLGGLNAPGRLLSDILKSHKNEYSGDDCIGILGCNKDGADIPGIIHGAGLSPARMVYTTPGKPSDALVFSRALAWARTESRPWLIPSNQRFDGEGLDNSLGKGVTTPTSVNATVRPYIEPRYWVPAAAAGVAGLGLWGWMRHRRKERERQMAGLAATPKVAALMEGMGNVGGALAWVGRKLDLPSLREGTPGRVTVEAAPGANMYGIDENARLISESGLTGNIMVGHGSGGTLEWHSRPNSIDAETAGELRQNVLNSRTATSLMAAMYRANGNRVPDVCQTTMCNHGGADVPALYRAVLGREPDRMVYSTPGTYGDRIVGRQALEYALKTPRPWLAPVSKDFSHTLDSGDGPSLRSARAVLNPRIPVDVSIPVTAGALALGANEFAMRKRKDKNSLSAWLRRTLVGGGVALGTAAAMRAGRSWLDRRNALNAYVRPYMDDAGSAIPLVKEVSP